MRYVCTLCGQIHEGLPDVAFERPAYTIPENEREKRVHLSADFCIVDNEDYFIRGIIEIPIHGQDENFGIGAWVSQKQENYETYKEHFDTSEIGPFFGWLSNDFIFEGARTLHLKTMVHFQGQGLRPRIDLEPTEHPLALAQRDGISLEQVWLFVHRVNGD